MEKVYLVGDIRLPGPVRVALDLKNSAFQKTLQREQEVAQAKAEADIKIAEARGRAESTLVEARAQADSNRILSESITPELVRYRSIDKWNGEPPGSTAVLGRFPSSTLGAASCRGSTTRRAEWAVDLMRIRCETGPAGPVFVRIASGYSGLAVGEERDESRVITGG